MYVVIDIINKAKYKKLFILLCNSFLVYLLSIENYILFFQEWTFALTTYLLSIYITKSKRIIFLVRQKFVQMCNCSLVQKRGEKGLLKKLDKRIYTGGNRYPKSDFGCPQPKKWVLTSQTGLFPSFSGKYIHDFFFVWLIF